MYSLPWFRAESAAITTTSIRCRPLSLVDLRYCRLLSLPSYLPYPRELDTGGELHWSWSDRRRPRRVVSVEIVYAIIHLIDAYCVDAQRTDSI